MKFAHTALTTQSFANIKWKSTVTHTLSHRHSEAICYFIRFLPTFVVVVVVVLSFARVCVSVLIVHSIFYEWSVHGARAPHIYSKRSTTQNASIGLRIKDKLNHHAINEWMNGWMAWCTLYSMYITTEIHDKKRSEKTEKKESQQSGEVFHHYTQQQNYFNKHIGNTLMIFMANCSESSESHTNTHTKCSTKREEKKTKNIKRWRARHIA